MVFGKLFGRGKGEKKPRRQTEEDYYLAWRQSLDPEWNEVLNIVFRSEDVDRVFKSSLQVALSNSDLDEARRLLRLHILPQLPTHLRDQIKHAGQHQSWATIGDLEAAGASFVPDKVPPDVLNLGWVEVGEDGMARVRFQGEGHLLTVAPTGAGKGRRFIIRNLLDYEGPAIVFDPKGENYQHTAWRRSLYGPVFKWAPGEAGSDCYNPMDFVETLDDARVLADLLIVRMSAGEFWDESATDLLTGLISYVKQTKPPERQNLRQVISELAGSDEDFKAMLAALKATKLRDNVELANVLERQFDKLQTSIVQTLLTHLKAWKLPEIVRTTSTTTPGFSMADIVANDYYGAQFAATQGQRPGWCETGANSYAKGAAASIYICVQSHEIPALRAGLRVILGQMLNENIKARAAIDKEMQHEEDLPKRFPHWPVMYLFDELPQLGYMPLIENAVAIARGYNIRLWLFTQDLAQLSEVYPKWRSIVANCRSQIYFKPNDQMTAEEIATRLGRRKDIWGGEDWVASPQRLMSREFWEDAIIFQDGLSIRAHLYQVFGADPVLEEWMEEQKAMFGDTVERAPPAPEPPDLTFIDEVEVENEPAAAIAQPSKKKRPKKEETVSQETDEYKGEYAALRAASNARDEMGKKEANSADPDEAIEGPSDRPKAAPRPPKPPSFDE
jgi:hypothetical protein